LIEESANIVEKAESVWVNALSLSSYPLRIRIPAERHGVPCVRLGVASRVLVLKSSIESSSVC
jgi:hypothetical protein